MASKNDLPSQGRSSTEASFEHPYDPSKLGILTGMEAVRKKPGMYIGGTDERALHQCVLEILDNSVNEYLAGTCTKIDMSINVDGSVSVRDNGRGIPVDIHPYYKTPMVELVLTTLFTNAMDQQGGWTYYSNTHGVGANCVNAVSACFNVEVSCDGKVHRIEFRRGTTFRKLEVIGKAQGSGTLINFKPDPEIFRETVEFNADLITKRIRETAWLYPGLEITLTDERIAGAKSETYHYPNGVVDFVRHLGEGRQPLHSDPISFSGRRSHEFQQFGKTCTVDIFADIALQFHDSGGNPEVLGYTNGIYNSDGGAHEAGFHAALTRATNRFARKNGWLKKVAPAIKGRDLVRGLLAVISIKHPDPKFAGAAKDRLWSPEVAGFVRSTAYGGLMAYFEDNPSVAKRIVDQALKS